MKKILWFFLLAVSFGPSVSAFEADDIKVELQFYTQTYRQNEPINVLLNIVNVSGRDVSFLLSSHAYETFFFIVRTPRNEQIPLIDNVMDGQNEEKSSAGEYREIVLKPGEVFSKKIDITSWFDIKESGYYFIKGLFFPNPDKKATNESFDYKILVKPPQIIENRLLEEEQNAIKDIEDARKLPPYEVIADLLKSKMEKNWDKFLSHIDAERLIQAFNSYYKAYENARSGRYKLQILDDFKKYLSVYWQDTILSYEVTESMIKKNDATVVCDVEYKVRNTSYKHRYEFKLYKNHADEWLVYNYIVTRIQ